MAVVASRFPLLRLPIKALNHAVKTMDILDRISLSLVSKVTKSVVVRCGVSISFIRFYMQEAFFVTLTHQNLDFTWCLSQRHKTWDGSNPVELTAASVVQVAKSRTENYRWKKEGFEIKDWIKHFQDITRIHYIHRIVFGKEGERFDVDSVARTIKPFNVNALVVSNECSSKYANSIFKKVHTNHISLVRNLFPRKVALGKVLIQNSNTVYTHTNFPIKLNDLLMMNCEVFDMQARRNFSLKIFNRFLKIWRTGFNRRLTRVMIKFSGNFAPDKNVILKGIDYIEVTPTRFDFRGANGSRATLLFQHRLSRIMLFVSDGNRIQL
ncbi:hypothetical protein CAEBREN_17084 [Caenorhabditis brenneri]|uniref:F-box domain-containing protein n=1 Tax=Caenorhabditis brenneri TaxID=135651 RepID=G0MC51_CAEBE|nr:hypothetical protein CAEBREN_17084 [Caenorhabditis brenneri]